MTPAVPDLSAGFVHKGRIVYALEYWIETPPPCSRNLIVWLTLVVTRRILESATVIRAAAS
jgi:hypothetical protein